MTPQKMLLEMRMRKAHLMLQSKDQVRKPPGTYDIEPPKNSSIVSSYFLTMNNINFYSSDSIPLLQYTI